MVIIALDIGEVRCGVAKSDATGLIASTYTTLKYDHEDYETALDLMLDVIDEIKPDRIVIGFPKKLDNTIGAKGELSIAFKEALENEVDIPIELWDERFTTVMSNRMLIDANVSRKKRKQVVDKIAATFILQGYLDAKRNGITMEGNE